MSIINFFRSLFTKKKEPTAQLANLYVLHENNYPCDKCQLESDDCRKLHFADRTICVTDKSQVVTFSKRRIRRTNK